MQRPLTLDPAAARTLREEIERAGGREVCFLAQVTPDRSIVNPRAVARGNPGAVLAAVRDANQGEILLHNHPSGVLEPSEADLSLAARVYEDGIGTGIVDNQAESLYVVVEPPEARTRASLDRAQLEAHLAPGGSLAGLFPGYEDRPAQREMLGEVVRRFNEGGVALVEAGTGTGKSLAYLIPAAAWALANGERTVVSTNTINLQEQLVAKDLPLVRAVLGQDFRFALVKGRGNYISIRRLHLARQTAPDLFEDDRGSELDALVEWTQSTRDGSLADLVAPPSDEVWDEVRSDGDICMGARCPQFQRCFYQRARREASSAEVLVVNHALLFADLSLRNATENWAQSAVLPAYRHVILDEGHNVEDVATSHLGAEVTRTGLFRFLARLDRNGKGLLRAVEEALMAPWSGGENATRLAERLEKRVRPAVGKCREALTSFFDALDPRVPDAEEEPLRLGRGDPRDPAEDPEILELLDGLRASFARLGREVAELRVGIEEDAALTDLLAGRLLDLQSAERRIESANRSLGLILDPERDKERFVRWIEGRGGSKGTPNVLLAAAPVEPGELLEESLFRKVETTVVTSATLATGGGFRFMRERLGLAGGMAGERGGPRNAVRGGDARGGAEADDFAHELAFADIEVPILEEDLKEPLDVSEMLLASPFDYATQTLFCVPSDLPAHDSGLPFQEATARVVSDLAEMTGGGIFVLFTSHKALRTVAALLRAAGVDQRWPLMVHGEAPRHRLLTSFVSAGDAILLGTASFWEGVDVPGDPLRGLVLQKIPFRVPNEPITQARMEAIEARGERAFDTYQLPLAALRLKQGFGRLVRSREDRGGILLLDSRILSKSYGRALLRTLPAAPLVKGPWDEVKRRLEDFYGGLPDRSGRID